MRDIDFRKGQKVLFTESCEKQVMYGHNDDPAMVLTVGQEYEIEDVWVFSWHTQLSLVGIQGKFNSVSFDVV